MREKMMGILMAAVSLAALPSAGASVLPSNKCDQTQSGIGVEFLGPEHTIIRVEPTAKYLLLPVQESNDDSRITVVRGGRQEKELFVRLATTRVDFFVPLDLSAIPGEGPLLLNVYGRQGTRDGRHDETATGSVAWSALALSDHFDRANREKYRPAYHHTPGYGWMNDPNGMFFRDGLWHLYYQYNPYGSKWQNMSWGHSVTSDLVHWEDRGIALEPDGLGSVFSGSAALDPGDTAGFGSEAVLAMYTGAGASQVQNLVWSEDGGQTFRHYPGNPVITTRSEARDPNMFWNPEIGKWNLILAHALEKEMLIYSSPDMKEWTLESAFGKGLGAQDGVWECPDLFELPVAGEKGLKKWVLICNLNPGGPFGGSGIQYFIGDFDGHQFTPDRDASGNVPTKWLDFGKDNYALVSWSDAPDGRRTAIGWMSNWEYANEVPTQQFRSANTLPREIGLFRGADGELYASSAPSPEMKGLHGTVTVNRKSLPLNASPKHLSLPEVNGGICEIELTLTAGKNDKVELTLANPAGEKCVMVYDTKAQTLSFDRTRSGLTDFSANFPAVTVAPTFSSARSTTLRIFIDRCSVEVFGDDGRYVMTNLVFPTTPYTTLSLSCDGGKATASDIRIISLNP